MIDDVIKIWRELNEKDRIVAIEQLKSLVTSDTIEKELNAENEIISEGIQKLNISLNLDAPTLQ